MSSTRKCCVPNCGKKIWFCFSLNNTGSEKEILHKFPNPKREPKRFRTWIYNIGGSILALENDIIFKRRRVCHLHFEAQYHTRSKFLSADAIPRLCLPAIRPVLHSENLLIPVTSASIEMDNSQPFTSSRFVDDNSEFEEIQTKPHFITQEELNDLVQDLNLSKKQTELLRSRLKGWNLLHNDTKISYI